MAKRQQVWVGTALGALGLLALFGVLYVVSGGGDVALDGDQIQTAGAGDGAAVEGSDDLGNVTISGAAGQVRSFGSDDRNPIGSDDASGGALRVVTDESPAGSVASEEAKASTSSTSTTAAPKGAPSETSTTTAIGSSSTSPTTAAPSTANSPTTATTAAPTDANETTSTQRRTTTTKASSSSSSPTTATTAATTTRPPTTTSDSSSSARTFEQEVIRLTNEERSAGGCGPLTNNDKLHTAALDHSVDMAENNYFSHTSQDGSSMVDRIERQGYRWRSLAENIAAGYRSPASVVDGWMNSSGHRANIMNCDLTEIGVGFHDYYWTQNFGTPR